MIEKSHCLLIPFPGVCNKFLIGRYGTRTSLQIPARHSNPVRQLFFTAICNQPYAASKHFPGFPVSGMNLYFYFIFPAVKNRQKINIKFRHSSKPFYLTPSGIFHMKNG